jgi:riboflavin-specific deaminase-like protein
LELGAAEPTEALALALAQVVAAEARPVPPERPWVMVNMVASVDGASTVAGRSGPLGGRGDRAMFTALRAVPDVILVGAGTVRAERYGPPRITEPSRAERRSRGQEPAPRLAVVSRSLELDPGADLFSKAEAPPLVLTTVTAPAHGRARLAGVAEIVEAGEDRVDLRRAMVELARRGARVVLAEGGPHLNGDLVAADLVDEWRLTLAPTLAGGSAERIAVGPEPPAMVPLLLDRAYEHDGELLLRYLAARSLPAPPSRQ